MSHPLAGKDVWFIALTGDRRDGCMTTELPDGRSAVCVFATERAAKLDSADTLRDLIDEFMRGNRDDYDLEEVVLEGQVGEDGHIYDEFETDWGLAADELETKEKEEPRSPTSGCSRAECPRRD